MISKEKSKSDGILVCTMSDKEERFYGNFLFVLGSILGDLVGDSNFLLALEYSIFVLPAMSTSTYTIQCRPG